MILLLCADDHMGLAFNHRRQSRDAVVCQHILERTGGAPLWMTPYSAKLFDGAPHIKVSQDCLDLAGAGEYCFVELTDPTPYLDRAEGIVLYRWSRSYPADVWFTGSLKDWHCTQQSEFPGRSHERITVEEYVR